MGAPIVALKMPPPPPKELYPPLALYEAIGIRSRWNVGNATTPAPFSIVPVGPGKMSAHQHFNCSQIKVSTCP